MKIKDKVTLSLLKEVIYSFATAKEKSIGMPIGNLTSQIFANIYLNVLDRFVKRQLKPTAYLPYGDDFFLVETDLEKLKGFRTDTVRFLENELKLLMNEKNYRILKAKDGLRFLRVVLWPSGRILNKRSMGRASYRLTSNNISSFSGLIKEHGGRKHIKHFKWLVYKKLGADFIE